MVMLNLLRFRPGGRACYEEYARHLAATFLPRYGARVIYAGDGSTPLVAGQGQAWDAVLLVRYPSREASSGMVADPDYQQVTHLRTEALTAAVLQATVPGRPPPADAPGIARRTRTDPCLPRRTICCSRLPS
jgi:uncharacterized protein (DUF1330 family)